MKEVYYTYRVGDSEPFHLIPDNGRRMSDIEVDVAISHREGVPLGTIRWHKVFAGPERFVKAGLSDKMACLSGLICNDDLCNVIDMADEFTKRCA